MIPARTFQTTIHACKESMNLLVKSLHPKYQDLGDDERVKSDTFGFLGWSSLDERRIRVQDSHDFEHFNQFRFWDCCTRFQSQKA